MTVCTGTTKLTGAREAAVWTSGTCKQSGCQLDEVGGNCEDCDLGNCDGSDQADVGMKTQASGLSDCVMAREVSVAKYGASESVKTCWFCGLSSGTSAL